jgi:hypothetical protein
MLQCPTDKRLLPDEKPTLGFELGLCGVKYEGRPAGLPLQQTSWFVRCGKYKRARHYRAPTTYVVVCGETNRPGL